MNAISNNINTLTTVPYHTGITWRYIVLYNNLYKVASLPLLGTLLVGSIDVIIPVISVVVVMSLIKMTVLTFEVVPNKTP